MGEQLVVGVDVGSASVRAVVGTRDGRVLGRANRPITEFSVDGRSEFAEQSTEEIWKQCCDAVRGAMQQTEDENASSRVVGVGFTGTCSLVVLGDNFEPVCISLTGERNRNIVMWKDHRAVDQADRINRMGHAVLRYVGGKVSPEMQAPKLLWLCEQLPRSFARAKHFMDLPDWLSFRATGCAVRSLCTLVCKWNYVVDEETASDLSAKASTSFAASGWDDSYWSAIGLGCFTKEHYVRIGSQVTSPGVAVGEGLTQASAGQLGLPVGTAVGASLIDAHAGGVGVTGVKLDCQDLREPPLSARLALICGTSTCHMAISRQPCFVPGVWGPYFSAMIPNWWLNEGGQSASGELLQFITSTHPAAEAAKQAAKERGCSVFDLLNRDALVEGDRWPLQTVDLHLLPDFRGNRSPVADASLRGVVCGLSFATDLSSLVKLYCAAIIGIALGTNHIIEKLRECGHTPHVLIACGSVAVHNDLFIQAHADATGLPVAIVDEPEAVSLGAAMLGACASSPDVQGALEHAMASMAPRARIVRPAEDDEIRGFYQRKYIVHQRMLKDQLAYGQIMTSLTL